MDADQVGVGPKVLHNRGQMRLEEVEDALVEVGEKTSIGEVGSDDWDAGQNAEGRVGMMVNRRDVEVDISRPG